jgi:hypothetical protein
MAPPTAGLHAAPLTTLRACGLAVLVLLAAQQGAAGAAKLKGHCGPPADTLSSRGLRCEWTAPLSRDDLKHLNGGPGLDGFEFNTPQQCCCRLEGPLNEVANRTGLTRQNLAAADGHCFPHTIVVGAQKAGTTALFAYVDRVWVRRGVREVVGGGGGVGGAHSTLWARVRDLQCKPAWRLHATHSHIAHVATPPPFLNPPRRAVTSFSGRTLSRPAARRRTSLARTTRRSWATRCPTWQSCPGTTKAWCVDVFSTSGFVHCVRSLCLFTVWGV